MNKISRFLIAATNSGSGKTTLTLGLSKALFNRAYKVQTFKCGPDYIDTQFHELVSGNESINLDLFLSSPEHVKYLYHKYSFDKEVSIVEGVMGLFDGYAQMKGSSAEIAELLDLPVILVVNAKSMAYSAAPLLYGFKNFYKKLHVIGVIFNFVGSENHYHLLKEACDDVNLECFGYLPKDSAMEVPSRHLGLNLDKKYRCETFIDPIAANVEKYIDLDKILASTQTDISIPVKKDSVKPEKSFSHKIAIASDDAFNFMYRENLEHLKKIGTVHFFSPLKDKILPEADLIYLPGGYPELFLKELSENKTMVESIRQYIEKGGKLLAECGGMMYLSASVTDENGCEYRMVDVFSQKASMKDKKLQLGYRQFNYRGLNIKGHEFHYSTIEGQLKSEVQQYNAKNVPVDTRLLRYKNTIAGYTHIYWAEMDNLMNLFD